ncbi:MAG: hypothetical protein U1F76_10335 [Candidatus Competibacteraceae bacterium]
MSIAIILLLAAAGSYAGLTWLESRRLLYQVHRMYHRPMASDTKPVPMATRKTAP